MALFNNNHPFIFQFKKVCKDVISKLDQANV